MPNDWFQFKSFKVHQDRCAMKVSTDACIQGAWAAQQWQSPATPQSRILDIGTGTGLLSLMLAQALPAASFDAVEINHDAFIQAGTNFEASPWNSRMALYYGPLATFKQQPGQHNRYHFIICNPPFFHNHLESEQQARNDARHSQSLSKAELAAAIAVLLAPGGQACVMFPDNEWDGWVKTALQNDLHPISTLHVIPKPGKAANRIIGMFTKGATAATPTPQARQLIIYDTDKQYTAAMRELLQAYYLAF